jgi:hypothetical protein
MKPTFFLSIPHRDWQSCDSHSLFDLHCLHQAITLMMIDRITLILFYKAKELQQQNGTLKKINSKIKKKWKKKLNEGVIWYF